MTAARLDVAYSPDYLGWLLGPGHPTDPRRAKLAVELLVLGLPRLGFDIEVLEPVPTTVDALSRVHSDWYLAETLAGRNAEWDQWGVERPDLGRVAALMCGGTELLARRILAGDTRVGFNPQGAKHHAHRARGGGFCVFNDMALAAHIFMDAGMRVAYLDLDAHHGDGVEALLQLEASAVTASVHEGGIFPGTGLSSVPEAGVHNWPLSAESGDQEWLAAVGEAVEVLRACEPDVLLVAIGADAHEDDPLSSLKVTESGYRAAGRQVGELVHAVGVPLLMGGAGGYQPLTWTPRVWVTFVTEVLGHAAAAFPAPLAQHGRAVDERQA